MKQRFTFLDRIAMAIFCSLIGVISSVIVWIIIAYGGNTKFHLDAFWFAVGSFGAIGLFAGLKAADFIGICFHGAFWTSATMIDTPLIEPGKPSFESPVFFTFIFLLFMAIIVVLSIW